VRQATLKRVKASESDTELPLFLFGRARNPGRGITVAQKVVVEGQDISSSDTGFRFQAGLERHRSRRKMAREDKRARVDM
jgi:hypothetical protein